jgi:hypothetical protein
MKPQASATPLKKARNESLSKNGLKNKNEDQPILPILGHSPRFSKSISHNRKTERVRASSSTPQLYTAFINSSTTI